MVGEDRVEGVGGGERVVLLISFLVCLVKEEGGDWVWFGLGGGTGGCVKWWLVRVVCYS